jgi:hypothetical protein
MSTLAHYCKRINDSYKDLMHWSYMSASIQIHIGEDKTS